MHRIAVVTIAVALLFAGPAAANAHGDLDAGPGVVGPASPIYGLEVAADNAAVSVGLAQAGGIAQERAAEAAQAAANDNPDAATKAATQAGAVAERADSEEDVEGIAKAMASLNETIATMERRAQNAPNEQARQGMLTAADNMKSAVNNMERAKRRMAEAGGNEGRGDERANRTAANSGPSDR